MKLTTLAVFIMAVVAVTVVVEAKSAPPPVDCTSVVLSMSDCLSYVTNGSTVVKPEGNCCSGLKSVLKTDAECLCEAFKSSSQFGVVLNISKALSLPDACHVHAPSAAKCGLSLSPTGAPSPVSGGVLPPAYSPLASSTANAPAGSVLTPSVAPAGSSSSAIGISIKLLVVGFAVALFSGF